jgi:26S proteasome regulatory subunit N7
MAPWLASDPLLSSQIDDGPQGTLYKQLQKKNEEEIKRLQDKLEDAETNLGETEMSDVLRAKATYLARIGEKVSL